MKKIVNGELKEMTEAEIVAFETLAELNRPDYRELRRRAYPDIDKLVVALWEQIVEGDNGSIVDLQNRRLAVKMKYPKGE